MVGTLGEPSTQLFITNGNHHSVACDMVECASRISRYIDSSVYRYESNSERRNRYVLELKLVAGGSQAGRNLLDSGLSSQITTAASITRLGVFVDSYDGCGSEIVLWSLPRTFFPSFAGSRSGQNIYTLHAKNLFISPLNCSTHRERTLACFTGGGRTLPRQLLQVQRRSAPSLTSYVSLASLRKLHLQAYCSIMPVQKPTR